MVSYWLWEFWHKSDFSGFSEARGVAAVDNARLSVLLQLTFALLNSMSAGLDGLRLKLDDIPQGRPE